MRTYYMVAPNTEKAAPERVEVDTEDEQSSRWETDDRLELSNSAGYWLFTY